ncbi:MAG: thioesterase II family protein [Trebonia sp.]
MAPGDRWLRRFVKADEAPVRLVCLPHAGGTASFYLPLCRALAPQIDVLVVQYPGRQDRFREAALPDVDSYVTAIQAALEPWLDRAVAFFGHSMGAVFAFEIAKRLQHAGRPSPAHVFVSSRRAPSRPRPENRHTLDDRSLIADLVSMSGDNGLAEADFELLASKVAPVLRADLRALASYRGDPNGCISAPITAMRGYDDASTSHEDVLAWRHHTNSAFTMKTFPGGHFYLIDHLQDVTETLATTLCSRPDLIRRF